MKLIIASDIHGSAYYAKKLVEILQTENADKLILLGDIYNHGPRNPFPEQYNTMSVSEILNAVKDKLLVIKGNCDSAVDQMISEFDFIEHAVIYVENKSIFLTHGHVFNKDALPKTQYNAIIYGHFHTGFIEKIDDIVVANAGSVSLPKNGTPNSYMILDNTTLSLLDFNGKVVAKTIL